MRGPACYLTCNLYQPRSDLRCRRFQFGCLKNTAFKSIRGYGVEITFKKWAKLEAFGATTFYPLRTAMRWARMIERFAGLTNVIGKAAHRINGNNTSAALTYELSERLLNRRARERVEPDAFLLEVYNPVPQTVRLQLIFSMFRENIRGGDSHRSNAGPPLQSLIRLPFHPATRATSLTFALSIDSWFRECRSSSRWSRKLMPMTAWSFFAPFS